MLTAQAQKAARRYAEICVHRFGKSKAPAEDEIRDWMPVFRGISVKEIEEAMDRIGLDPDHKSRFAPSVYQVASNARAFQEKPRQYSDTYETDLAPADKVKLLERCRANAEVLKQAMAERWPDEKALLEILAVNGAPVPESLAHYRQPAGSKASRHPEPVWKPLLYWWCNVAFPMMCRSCGYNPKDGG